MPVGNISFKGNLNGMSSLRLLQLNRLLDFCKWCRDVFGNVGRQFLFCSPDYPCILVSSWMNQGNITYGLLSVGDYTGISSVLASTASNDGKLTYVNFDNSVGYILVYPGYGVKMWTGVSFTNDGNGNGNLPLTYENDTSDIQWCRAETGLHSEGDNVYNHGINLNQTSPSGIPAQNLNPNGVAYIGISSIKVYKLP